MSIDNLVIKRHFKAPPERVFAAFTEKSLMQAWYGPENMTVPHCEVDARVGGKYRVELHAPSGSVHIVTGEFREIRPPSRLVYTWGWLNGSGRGPETIVTLTFSAREGGTDLTLEQSGFLTQEARDQHGHGWNASWPALDAALEGRPKPMTPTPTISATIGPPTFDRRAWPSRRKASPIHVPARAAAIAGNPRLSTRSARCRPSAAASSRSTRRARSCGTLTRPMPGPAADAKRARGARKSRTMDQRAQLLWLSGDHPQLRAAIRLPARSGRQA